MKRLGGYFKMNVIRIILSVILAIDCLGLIVLVLMQQSKQHVIPHKSKSLFSTNSVPAC